MASDVSDAPRVPRSARVWGRVVAADWTRMRVEGLGGIARIGDGLAIGHGEGIASAEIVALDRGAAIAISVGQPTRPASGERAWLVPSEPVLPGDHWLGMVIDPAHPPRMPFAGDRPPTVPTGSAVNALRRKMGAPLSTGVLALDTLLPLCRGQRLGIFAGSGVGKSMLLDAVARGCDADVTILALIGERGREIGEAARRLLDGPRGSRTAIVACASDRPAIEKRRAATMAFDAARHFRDAGRHVLLLVDSMTRVAEAHREIALASGETASFDGFPPSTQPLLASLAESAGPGVYDDRGGDVTAVLTVLVAGSDMDEPAADMLRGILDGHVVLDRAIAERGRFPAIDLRRSVSRSAPEAWTAEEAGLCRRARAIIAAYEDAAPMIRAGLYAPGNDPALDEAVRLYPALDALFGSEREAAGRDGSFGDLRRVLDGSSGATP